MQPVITPIARTLILTALMVAVAAGPEAVSAQTGRLVAPSAQAGPEARVARALKRSLSVRRLLNRLQPAQRQRVIVSLRTEDAGEAGAPPRALSRAQRRVVRRQAIARAQDRLLGRLSGLPLGRLFKPEKLPVMVLEADQAVLEKLMHADEVATVIEDRPFAPTLVDSRVQIGADIAGMDGYQGQGQAVAVLDTGVDGQHPAFAGRIVAPACFSSNSAASTSLCPGGGATSYAPDAGQNCVGIPSCDHGTHVAGIAAGDDPTFTGVAPRAAIVPIQVFSRFDSTQYCSSPPCLLSWTSDQIRALSYVLELAEDPAFGFKVAAANMSLGGDGASTITGCEESSGNVKAAVDALLAADVATVIAAGNRGRSTAISEPGCVASAVTVGSVDGSANGGLSVSGYSDRASWLDLMAPGQGIYAPVPGAGIGGKSGTSMATPHVAGAIAALRSKVPDASIQQIMAALSTGATFVTDPVSGIEYPRLRLDLALDLLEPGNPRPFKIVLDQSDSGSTLQGIFEVQTTTSAYGGEANVSNGAGTGVYRFVPDLPVSGLYRVSAWWPVSAAQSSATLYQVSGTLGTAPVIVDQSSGGAAWHALGEFMLESGSSSFVDISGPGTAKVSVDALMIELVNIPPLVALIAPQTNDSVELGSSVVLAGLAFDQDGQVVAVEFFVDGASIGTSVSAPYEVSWTPSAVGAWTVSAVAIDDLGMQSEPAMATITVTQNVPPPAPQTLLEERFDDATLSGWTVVDEGASHGPSAWSVSGGALSQWSNILGGDTGAAALPKPGTYLRYDAGGSWTDYRVGFSMSSTDNDTLGLMFRVGDGSNFYRFSWDSERASRRLVKNVNGVYTLLAQDAVRYVEGRTYEVEILAVGALLEVRVDGALVFSVADTSHSSGTLALYTWANNGARFDDVVVTGEVPSSGGNIAPRITALSASPASITDTQTSQLSVTAVDLDGPSALSYAWSVSNAGVLDDPSSATPVFTPSDLASGSASVTVTVTVTVSDGESSVSESMEILVADEGSSIVLLEERFDDATLSGWTVVDEGASHGPSAWSVSGGALSQWSNILGGDTGAAALPKPGTYLRYDAGGSWTDYRVGFSMSSTDNDTLGLMFRVGDDSNFYRFSWDSERASRRLVKNVNGVYTLLAQDAVRYVEGRTYEVEILAVGALLEVRVDGALVFSVADTSHSSGTLALYTWANNGARFDDVVVTGEVPSSGGNIAPRITALSASPASITDTQTSQLSVTAVDLDGPSALSYAWSVSNAGVLDDPSSTTPVFTPSDLASGSASVTVTVTVSDGESSVSESMEILVADEGSSIVLLEERFDDATLSGWTVVDEGASHGPSAWSVSGGALSQWSNILGGDTGAAALPKPGTYLRYDAGGSWTDYRVGFSMSSTDNDTLGLMFRVGDGSNFYRFSWDSERASRRLVKNVNGVYTLLAQDAVRYVEGRTYEVEILAVGALLEVRVDGALVFSVADTSHSSGTLALYTWANSGARFDDLTVEYSQ